jgi:hypothetical protein
MKYKYEKKITLHNDLVFVLPKDIEYISQYLQEITTEDRFQWYIGGYNSVLADKSESQNRAGELFTAKIYKDFTYLKDNFNLGQECRIETQEMKNLIEVWWEELKNFRKYQPL